MAVSSALTGPRIVTALPGPEAQQLAIYLGWLLHKVRGGLVAGVMFVLPSFFLLLALSWVYVAHGDVTYGLPGYERTVPPHWKE